MRPDASPPPAFGEPPENHEVSTSAEALFAGERLFVWGSPEPMGAPGRWTGTIKSWARSLALQALIVGERLRAQGRNKPRP